MKILTDTSERQELVSLSESRKRKVFAKKQKRCLFRSKRKRACPPSSKTLSSSETDSSEVEYDGDTDMDSDMDITEGDFVIVKCYDKSRFVHYIAQIDMLNGEEFQFEGVFLQKVAGKVGADNPVFVPNLTNEAGFEQEHNIFYHKMHTKHFLLFPHNIFHDFVNGIDIDSYLIHLLNLRFDRNHITLSF